MLHVKEHAQRIVHYYGRSLVLWPQRKLVGLGVDVFTINATGSDSRLPVAGPALSFQQLVA